MYNVIPINSGCVKDLVIDTSLFCSIPAEGGLPVIAPSDCDGHSCPSISDAWSGRKISPLPDDVHTSSGCEVEKAEEEFLQIDGAVESSGGYGVPSADCRHRNVQGYSQDDSARGTTWSWRTRLSA